MGRKNRANTIKEMLRNENFTIAHYLGSWRRYSFREDARMGSNSRSYPRWKDLANKTKGETTSWVILPWLKGFIELVGGPDEAAYLLQEAGEFPEGYNAESLM